MRLIGLTVVAVVVLYLSSVTPAFGVILHPDGEPGVGWTDKPNDNVVGQWGNNASCVAIASNYVITTRHQGWKSTVVIGGVTYYTQTVTDGDGGGTGNNADIRIARITTDAEGLHDANLTDYVGLYTGTDEAVQNFVLGGFGEGREDTLKTSSGVAYGYSWTGTDKSNETLRWGTNRVDAVVSDVHVGSYISDTIRGDFDETGTEYEAASAEYDSGGGWFIKVGGEWQLAALSAYVEHLDETWFRNSVTGNLDPDQFWGIRISSYSEWIDNTIPEPGTMTLLTLGAAGMILRRRRKA